MSDSLVDLFATDAQLDLIGARQYDGSGDLVLAGLALLAMAVDEAPLPPAALPTCRNTPMSRARKGSWALAVTVAMMVTSSGVAEAVSDSPFGPLRYVTTQVWKLGPHDHHRVPGWTLNGADKLSGGVGVGSGSGRGSVPGASGGSGVLAGAGSVLGEADARRAGHPRDNDAGRVPGQLHPGGHGPSSGTGHGHGPGGGKPPITRPPGDNGGNTGNGPGSVGNVRGPGNPTNGDGPGQPNRPGHGQGQRPNGGAGENDYGRVPGAGTGSGTSTGHGTGHCRVEGPTKASEPGGGGGGHRSCHGDTKPGRPKTPGLSTPPTPKLTPPPRPSTPPGSTTGAPAASVPRKASERGEG